MLANQVKCILVVFVSIRLTVGNPTVLNATIPNYNNGTTIITEDATSSQGAEDVVSINPEKAEPKIVGGQAAKQGQFPYQVSLRHNGWSPNHFCGGSILDTQHVVTAGHCVVGKTPNDILVVAGDVLLDRSSCTSVRRTVSDIFLHESYNESTLENDVALLRVSKTFPTDDPNFMAIALAEQAVDDYTMCQVSGWGTLRENADSIPNNLQYVEVPITPLSDCYNYYSSLNTTINTGMICAGYDAGGKDSCQGDSGGPLQCDGKLTGIVSFGYGCDRPYAPGVYTDVHYYYSWINETKYRVSSAAITRGCYMYILALLVLFVSTP